MVKRRGESAISKAVCAVKYVHMNKFWTISSLASHLNITYASAVVYFDYLSIHYPVKAYREARTDRRGSAAIYTLFD